MSLLLQCPPLTGTFHPPQKPVNPQNHENPGQSRAKHLSYEFHPIRYTGYRAIKTEKPQPALGFSMEETQ
jgi:hypothetical protein